MGEMEYLVLKDNLDIVGISEKWWNRVNLWNTVITGISSIGRTESVRLMEVLCSTSKRTQNQLSLKTSGE